VPSGGSHGLPRERQEPGAHYGEADEFERVVDVVNQPRDQTDGLEWVATVCHYADRVMAAERGDVANYPDGRAGGNRPSAELHQCAIRLEFLAKGGERC
jgi:hypothetical protein